MQMQMQMQKKKKVWKKIKEETKSKNVGWEKNQGVFEDENPQI